MPEPTWLKKKPSRLRPLPRNRLAEEAGVLSVSRLLTLVKTFPNGTQRECTLRAAVSRTPEKMALAQITNGKRETHRRTKNGETTGKWCTTWRVSLMKSGLLDNGGLLAAKMRELVTKKSWNMSRSHKSCSEMAWKRRTLQDSLSMMLVRVGFKRTRLAGLSGVTMSKRENMKT